MFRRELLSTCLAVVGARLLPARPGKRNASPAIPRAPLGMFCSVYPDEESFRPNLPGENWLLALLNAGVKATRELLAAHEAKEGGACDCDCCLDAEGLLFNLEVSESCIDGQLIPVDLTAFAAEVERRTGQPPAKRRPQEVRLLRVLTLLLSAADAVEHTHDQAAVDGNCGCILCSEMFGLVYNVNNTTGAFLMKCPL